MAVSPREKQEILFPCSRKNDNKRQQQLLTFLFVLLLSRHHTLEKIENNVHIYTIHIIVASYQFNDSFPLPHILNEPKKSL